MPRFARRVISLVAAVVVGASLVGSCTAAASPNPSSACNGADEQSAPGFYPGLEALLPARVGAQALSSVRSGRYCSARTLGSLDTVGIHELEFAGGALPDPANKEAGMALVVYRADGLTLDQLADAQANGAGSTQGAAGLVAQRTAIEGHSGIRIDVTVESGPEMMFFWPTAIPGTYDAVTGIGETEDQVRAAVASFGTVDAGTVPTATSATPAPPTP